MTAIRETPQHRAAERRLASALAEMWRCTLNAAAQFAPYDYVASRNGRVVALVELKIKHSRHWYGYDATILLDKHKHDALGEAAGRIKCRAFVVWYFPDDACAFVLHTARVDTTQIEMVGRSDRGRHERRPAYRVPLALARRIDL